MDQISEGYVSNGSSYNGEPGAEFEHQKMTGIHPQGLPKMGGQGHSRAAFPADYSAGAAGGPGAQHAPHDSGISETEFTGDQGEGASYTNAAGDHITIPRIPLDGITGEDEYVDAEVIYGGAASRGQHSGGIRIIHECFMVANIDFACVYSLLLQIVISGWSCHFLHCLQ